MSQLMRLALAGNREAATVFWDGVRAKQRAGVRLAPEVARLLDQVLEADRRGESPARLWQMLGLARRPGWVTAAATAADLRHAVDRDTYVDAAVWFVFRSGAAVKPNADGSSASQLAADWIEETFGVELQPETILRWYERRRGQLVAAAAEVAAIAAGDAVPAAPGRGVIALSAVGRKKPRQLARRDRKAASDPLAVDSATGHR